MSNHSVILKPFQGNRSRNTCPNCGKRFEFVRYVDTATNEEIAENVGRCNREINCGYHYTPRQYYEDNKGFVDLPKRDQFNGTIKPVQPVKPVEYLPYDLLEKTMKGYENNKFFQFLISLFREDVAMQLADSYYLGSSVHWPGANIFWQIDVYGNLRQAKIMLYEPYTGRRVKDGEDKVFFAGKKILNNYEANLQQCFFGEVLLTMNKKKRVAIVESEKTAMIASIYFPQCIWLATGGSHGCKWTTPEVCRVLERREVILFPDLGYFEKWQAKADQVRSQVTCKLVVSDLLEKNGTDQQRAGGWDLADYLLLNRDSSGLAMTAAEYPLIWDIKNELKIESV